MQEQSIRCYIKQQAQATLNTGQTVAAIMQVKPILLHRPNEGTTC
jgi:hypothetical protein